MTATLTSLVKAVTAALVPSSVNTSTVTGTGIDVTDYEGQALVLLDSGAGGSGATLDVKLQESDVVGSGYTDITGAAFTQVGNAASRQKLTLDINKTKKFVRALGTIGGTASFACSVQLVAFKKYQ